MQHSKVSQDARGSSSYKLSRIHAVARTISSESKNSAIVRQESSGQAPPTIIYLTGRVGFCDDTTIRSSNERGRTTNELCDVLVRGPQPLCC
jgi:hypothetical protein